MINLSNEIIIINNGATSKTFKAPHIFIKYVTNYLQYNVYEREKHLANILIHFDWFPKLLYSDDKNKFFIYENVGIPLTNKNKPNNIKEQFDKILNDLKSVNIQHNDIKLGELLINKNKKIFLCDFGWGSINNNLNCGIKIWGCYNKNKPGGYFDDKNTLKRLNLI